MRKLLCFTILLLVGCDNGQAADRKAPATVGSPASTPPPPLESATPAERAPTAPALVRVEDVSQVCMVNDQFMGRPQIPVPLEGKTYFGCCEMCKGRLENNASARTAKDPVSGQTVDKAVAVIAKRPNGDVLYFESEQTLARYRAVM